MENSKFYQIIKIYLKGCEGKGKGGCITTPCHVLLKAMKSGEKIPKHNVCDDMIPEELKGNKEQSVKNRIYILFIEWPGCIEVSHWIYTDIMHIYIILNVWSGP